MEYELTGFKIYYLNMTSKSSFEIDMLRIGSSSNHFYCCSSHIDHYIYVSQWKRFMAINDIKIIHGTSDSPCYFVLIVSYLMFQTHKRNK